MCILERWRALGTLLPDGVTGSDTMIFINKIISFITKTWPCVGEDESVSSVVHSDAAEELALEVSKCLLRTLGREFGYQSWLFRGQSNFSKQNECCSFPFNLFLVLDDQGAAGFETVAL